MPMEWVAPIKTEPIENKGDCMPKEMKGYGSKCSQSCDIKINMANRRKVVMWVLVIMLFSTSLLAPNTVTTIPGFQSMRTCMDAGREIQRNRTQNIEIHCVELK
jgi:hypothetical protein